MSRTYIETAEHGQVIMRCVDCSDWAPVMAPEVMGKDTFGGVPVWKIAHLAESHVSAVHARESRT